MQLQIKRMNEIINYQLQKAAAKGQQKLTSAVNPQNIIQKIITSLEKVYFEKHLTFDFRGQGGQQLYCEEGDLYEIAGNLLDNSAKWCQQRIKIQLMTLVVSEELPYSFLLQIEDDGCGIPENQLPDILKRGVRADENSHGHGIGMAVVYELVSLLEGELKGSRSPSLGGICWQVYLP
jgi:two-component system sensor histidine kinase PhoQ